MCPCTVYSVADFSVHIQQLWRILNGVMCVVIVLLEYFTDCSIRAFQSCIVFHLFFFGGGGGDVPCAPLVYPQNSTSVAIKSEERNYIWLICSVLCSFNIALMHNAYVTLSS